MENYHVAVSFKCHSVARSVMWRLLVCSWSQSPSHKPAPHREWSASQLWPDAADPLARLVRNCFGGADRSRLCCVMHAMKLVLVTKQCEWVAE